MCRAAGIWKIMAKDKFLEKQGRARHTALLLDDSFLWWRLLAAA
jgi:hypothetical protein